MTDTSFQRGRWSPATRKAYNINWRDFERFCVERHVDAMPALEQTIADYLIARGETHSTSALSQRLAAIVAAHAMQGHEVPVKRNVIRDAWAEIRRRKGTASKPKAALTADDIKRIVRMMPEAKVQERAVLLIGFASLMRRSELIVLDRSDVTFSNTDLTIQIRRSKTDKDGRGATVAIRRSGTAFCPVVALEVWLEHAEITAGPIFRTGDHRMAPDTVSAITKRWAGRAGFTESEIGAHSLRRGGITTMVRNGAKIEDVMRVSRHKTIGIALGYVEAERASLNPAIKRLRL